MWDGPCCVTLSLQKMQLVACFDLAALSAGFPERFVFVVCYSSGYPLAQPTLLPEREFGGLIPLCLKSQPHVSLGSVKSELRSIPRGAVLGMGEIRFSELRGGDLGRAEIDNSSSESTEPPNAPCSPFSTPEEAAAEGKVLVVAAKCHQVLCCSWKCWPCLTTWDFTASPPQSLIFMCQSCNGCCRQHCPALCAFGTSVGRGTYGSASTA